MVALYVVSSDKAAGKTAICGGLGKRLLADGKKVGYLRPRTAGGDDQTNGSSDVIFMKRLLALPEAPDSLCPLISQIPPDKIGEMLSAASPGRDVVIVEGQVGRSPDDDLSKVAYNLARTLSARVIAVEDYSQKTGAAGNYAGFGQNLLGVVLNKVPKSRLKQAQGEVRARYAAAGLNVLGILPEDRVLVAPTIGELADAIQGKILSGDSQSAELVENLIVGALTVDSGLLYFGRKANKAAILRVDRPDMQLAALETSTRCLVISGAATPIYYRVVEKAEAKGIPLVQSELDTNTIVARIEQALGKARFAQEKKLPRINEILQQSIDFKVLYTGLGLAG